ncbi:MAG: pre-toxin TG domain-containing protein [Pseudobdellovibrionaceae bacterium]|nr:pre-toxin TG domain-containing protein [Pseudobdellovibrionaceae bacterium]
MSEQWQENPTIQRDTELPGQRPNLDLINIYDNRPENIRRADNPDYNPDSNIVRDALKWMFSGTGGGQPGSVQIDAPPMGEDNIDIYDIKSGKVNTSGGMLDPNDPDIAALRQSADQTGNEFGSKRFLLEQRDYARDRSNQLVDELNRKQIDPFSKEIEQKLNALNAQVDAAIAGHNTNVTQVLAQTPENQNEAKPEGHQFKTAPYSANGQRVRAAQASVNYAKGVVAQMSGSAKARGESAVGLAQSAVITADEAYAAGEQEAGNFALEIATTALDVGLGLIPGVGFAKDVVEAATGYNVVTGAKLSTFERSMAVVGVLTGGVGSKLGIVAKAAVVTGIFRAGKSANEASEIAQITSRVADVASTGKKYGFSAVDDAKSFVRNFEPMDGGQFKGVLYPRGPGASVGPVPTGHVPVSRWVNESEIKAWYQGGGTRIPPDIGAGGRVYVTKPGAPRPGGTGGSRIDFTVPESMLKNAGNEEWLQIFQETANTPIYNVKLFLE